jgi:hypothetical protein
MKTVVLEVRSPEEAMAPPDRSRGGVRDVSFAAGDSME